MDTTRDIIYRDFVLNDEDTHLLDAACSVPACPVMLDGRCLIHALRDRRRISDR